MTEKSDQADLVGIPPSWPAFATIGRWGELSGMSRRATYEALGRGDLIGRKNGTQTVIDVLHGLRYLHGLPRAQIKAPTRKIAG